MDAADDVDQPYVCGQCELVCVGKELRRINAGLPSPLSEVVIFQSESRDNEPPEVRNHSSPA